MSTCRWIEKGAVLLNIMLQKRDVSVVRSLQTEILIIIFSPVRIYFIHNAAILRTKQQCSR